MLSPEGARTNIGGGVSRPGGDGKSACSNGAAESEQGKEEQPSGCWRSHDRHAGAFHHRAEVKERGLTATDPEWVSALGPVMVVPQMRKAAGREPGLQSHAGNRAARLRVRRRMLFMAWKAGNKENREAKTRLPKAGKAPVRRARLLNKSLE